MIRSDERWEQLKRHTAEVAAATKAAASGGSSVVSEKTQKDGGA